MADNTTDPCAADTLVNYNQSLHIGAVFIIFVASLLGAAFPLLGKRFPSISPSPFFYTCGQHIGTGVLLALGLIHLLTPAYESLGSECLSSKFLSYTYAPLFAMIAAVVMHFIDMLAVLLFTRNDAHSHSTSEESAIETHDGGHAHSIVIGKDIEASVAAYILEFGLTAHSVIIGIAVGVAPGKDLKSLIPALAFHQFFEGVALGARLANVGFSGFIEVLLTIIYSISAPIGIGIGIGVHNSYNPNSAKANYIQGTFDAIAAGIILYIAFVQMLAIDFTRDIRRVKGAAKKGLLILCLWVGAGVMAVLGKWL